MTLRTLAVVLAVAAAWSAPTRSARLQPDQPRPTFRTEANYVRVDVFPTKDGVPVGDLTADDFEVLEDKVPQKIDAFQHIVIRGGVPSDARREPNSVGESRAMARETTGRTFVIFLDVNHVEVEGSHRIRQPLVNALNGAIGAEDMVAVMTPEMSARDITFARRTTTIEGMLTRYWTWGERERLSSKDPIEDQYRACYPGQRIQCPDGTVDDNRGVYAEMIDRRREKQTIDALEDLVGYLRDLREERKAVFVVTDGWRLFRPDQALTRKLNCQVPMAQVYVDPRSGKPTTKAPEGPLGTSPDACERDRMTLAAIDDETEFRRMLDEANRANTSFYPIDPRGLAVFDTPMVPVNGPSLSSAAPMVPIATDQAMLASRIGSMRTLAEATDGLALVNSNDLGGGLKRVTDDLSSYYLLGYYSNGKLDGKFHSIAVRVKRPGLKVRARRGYLAATAGALAKPGTAAPSPADAAAAAETRAIEAVVGPLENYARDVPLRVQTAAGWKPGTPPAVAVWIVGQVGGAADEWRDGGEADIVMMSAAGETVATARASLAAGARTFRAALSPASPVAPGDYTVRIGLRAASAGSIPARDSVHVLVPAFPGAGGALVFRRGPSTANRDTPTADLRFRRSDQIRVEVPAPGAADPEARLLDRVGKPLALPVAAALRDDPDGTRWATAQLALAPLTIGDYVIEVSAAGTARTLVAFRIIP